MSTWRRKALEMFPELRREFESQKTSIYQAFFELLPRVRDAHKRQDEVELKKIYDFAKWCYQQRAKDLWNAAAVAFYEHLVDEQITREQIPYWIEPALFHDLAGLFKWRLGDEEYSKLCSEYQQKRKTLY